MGRGLCILNMKKEVGDREFWMGMYTLATVGLNMVASTFIGLGMGWLIDHKVFHGRTAPWFTMGFLFIGIVAGFVNIFRLIRQKTGPGDNDGDDTRPEG